MSRAVCVVFTLIFSVILIGWIAARSVCDIQFGRHIGGHLALAAAANSIDLAKDEMEIAIHQMEADGYTKGFTSILYTVPKEDVGFWYSNLKASLAELQAVTPATSNLERSNVLLKLHQTLTAHSSKDEDVFAPDGISVFP